MVLESNYLWLITNPVEDSSALENSIESILMYVSIETYKTLHGNPWIFRILFKYSSCNSTKNVNQATDVTNGSSSPNSSNLIWPKSVLHTIARHSKKVTRQLAIWRESVVLGQMASIHILSARNLATILLMASQLLDIVRAECEKSLFERKVLSIVAEIHNLHHFALVFLQIIAPHENV